MKIILIGNKAQQGKDTFAAMVHDELVEKQICPVIIHFADCLKYIATEYFGWNKVKNEAGRTLLQEVGSKVRDNDEHFWTDFVARFISFLAKNDGPDDWFLIPDWRYIEEYERLLEYFDYKDIITVNIERVAEDGSPYRSPIMTEEQCKHRSETELDGYICQYHITNLTLEGLKETAEEFVKDLINS